jgi:hypothetical protein
MNLLNPGGKQNKKKETIVFLMLLSSAKFH